MARQADSELTISCLQCDWSAETTNTSVELSTAFLEAAYAHVDAHEQHALEVVQRLRVYSENYVEPDPPAPDTPDTRSAAARRDAGIQTGSAWTGQAASIDYHLMGCGLPIDGNDVSAAGAASAIAGDGDYP